jgi:hypothetical protein
VGKISFNSREKNAIAAALKGNRDLLGLLSFSSVRITEYADQRNREIGQMLDSMNHAHYEWYGYSLAQKADLSTIVDTLIQPGQFVTEVDVDFNPKQAMVALYELERINRNESRTNTSSELVPVGIVHRHGSAKGQPMKSGKDILNLEAYLAWQAVQTEFLSKETDDFPQISKFVVEVKGSSVRLIPQKQDGLILSYDFGNADIHSLSELLKKPGANRDELAQLASLLLSAAQPKAEQMLLVSHATSLIYNQDGKSIFGEIAVNAKGAIEGKYYSAYAVPVEIVKGDQGHAKHISLSRDIYNRVSWAKKEMKVRQKSGVISYSREKSVQHFGVAAVRQWSDFWPESTPVVYANARKGSRHQELMDFYFASARYVARSGREKYSNYLFSVLSCIQNGATITNSIKAVGRLFENPSLDNCSMVPPIGSLDPEAVVTQLMAKGNNSQLEQLFVGEIRKSEMRHISHVLEDYVPKFLGGEK